MSAQPSALPLHIPKPAPMAPEARWLLGHAPRFNADTLAYLLQLRQYGDFIRLRFGPVTLHLANHPDYVHEMLVTKAASLKKPFFLVSQMDDAVGQGLFTADGELWKRQRKLAQPAFHTKRIVAYGAIMTDYSQRLMQDWQDGMKLDMEKAMTRLTMQIVTKALFASEVDGETDTLSQAMTVILGTINQRNMRAMQIPRWLPTHENRSMRQALSVLDQTIQHFVAERRKSDEDKGDLLKMLMDASDEQGGMSDKQLRDEVATVFGAGHETTANTLTWTWYLLSQHPEVEAKLHAELAQVLGGRTPSFEDLPQLKYTEQVVKESMRLYPPAFGVSRQATEDLSIGDYAVKREDALLANIWGMHRDERFFKDAEAFKPERFAPDAESDIPKYAYLPFGAGPRVCIGNAFAMMEARLVLATIAQKFRFQLAPDCRVAPERVFTLRPKYGMQMQVQAR